MIVCPTGFTAIRRRSPLAAALFAIAILVVPSTSRADEQPPVDVSLRVQPPPPNLGQVYQDTLVVVSQTQGVLANSSLGRQGWTIVNVSVAQLVQMLPLQELVVPFTIISTDRELPLLEVHFTLDGWGADTSLDLSQRAFALSKGPLPARTLAPGTQVAPMATGAPLP